MTVLSTNYSSIEDAWGFLNPELQPKKDHKKKKNKDPICELYNSRGHQSLYTDADLVSYVNKYDQYNKTDFQSSVGTKGREKMPKYIDIPLSEESKNGFENSFDFQPSKMIDQENETEQEEVYQERQGSMVIDEEDYRKPTHQELFYEDNRQSASPSPKYRYLDDVKNEINYLDLALYIISGILLIFMLDQFVRLGELLGR